jgi:NAD(P)H-dependent FMN reductase
MKPHSVNVLLFAASLRGESLNARLAALAGETMEKLGATVDRGTMRDFDAPSYDNDVETSDGLPPGPRELARRILANDAFVIVSPEYNASIPGYLKNAIDWVSRMRPQPFNAKHALLLSASPSMAGGNRGLWALRVPLEHMGTRVFPDMFSLAQAHKAFGDDGKLADAQIAKRFEENLRAFLDLVEAAKHYPCIKKAWVEFLGEPGDIGRVEAAE